MGKPEIHPKFDEAPFFSEGLAAVKIGRKWGYVNGRHTLVIKPRFTLASSFSEGLAAVKHGGKWGYIDKNGAWAIKRRFHQALAFSEQLAAVKVGRRWGYINRRGHLVIPPLYDETYGFRRGEAWVKIVGNAITGESGLYVDKTGRCRQSREDHLLAQIFGGCCPEDKLMQDQLAARIAALGEVGRKRYPSLFGIRNKKVAS